MRGEKDLEGLMKGRGSTGRKEEGGMKGRREERQVEGIRVREGGDAGEAPLGS